MYIQFHFSVFKLWYESSSESVIIISSNSSSLQFDDDITKYKITK